MGEVVDHLRGLSVQLDPDGAGINTILILDINAHPRITMDISLGKVISYICANSQLKFTTDGDAVIVFDPNLLKVAPAVQ